MYQVTINNVKNKDILNKIYTDIDLLKMGDVCLVYDLTKIKEYTEVKDIPAHVYQILLNEYPYTLEDLIMMLVELIGAGRTVVLKGSWHEFDLDAFNAAIQRLGNTDKLVLADSFFDKELDLGHLTYNELYVIHELLGIKHDVLTYNEKDVLVKLVVDDSGHIFYRGKSIMDLGIFHFYNIYNRIYQGVDTELADFYRLVARNSPLSPNMPNIVPFICYENPTEVLFNYKLKVFDQIKEIKPDQYDKLDIRLVKLLNTSKYMTMSSIMGLIDRLKA